MMPSAMDRSIPAATVRVALAALGEPEPPRRAARRPWHGVRGPAVRHPVPGRGQPAEAPWRLALITVLQFAEGLSDRAAADAVRSRIDWKYLLGLELDDPGFDHSVLSRFRDRLVAGGAETLLLDTLVDRCREAGLLRDRGDARTDSTHVLSAARRLQRLELAGETMRLALEAVAAAAPSWLSAHGDREWPARYARRFGPDRQRRSLEAVVRRAERIGADGHPPPRARLGRGRARVAARDPGARHAAP